MLFCGIIRSVTVFILIKAVPSIISWIEVEGLFYLHSCVLVLAVIYVWVFFPETKGKTLTELSSIYEKKPMPNCQH